MKRIYGTTSNIREFLEDYVYRVSYTTTLPGKTWNYGKITKVLSTRKIEE